MTHTEIPSHDDKCYVILLTSLLEIPVHVFIKVVERNFAPLGIKSRLMKDVPSETGAFNRVVLERFLVQGCVLREWRSGLPSCGVTSKKGQYFSFFFI